MKLLMIDYNKLFLIKPFSLNNKNKTDWYLKQQIELSNFHYKNCRQYKQVLDKIFLKINKCKKLINLPFLAANIFKNFNLISTEKKYLSNKLTSSGTSGHKKSIINLDKKTSFLQSKALREILLNFLPNERNIIFFIDSRDTINDIRIQNARTAAIKGFSQLFKESLFLLDENNNLNIQLLINFLKKNPNSNFVIFGFTSLVWKYLIKELKNKKINIKINNGILIHGGGWKKMENDMISKKIFNDTINATIGINKIYNYYGMVEQTGSIFMECEKGFFHTSIFSEIIIRDKYLKSLPMRREGLVQVLSLLPLSYPGHNILTEDIGSIQGIDNCKCGRKGKIFYIKGRVKGTDLRGCSDTYS